MFLRPLVIVRSSRPQTSMKTGAPGFATRFASARAAAGSAANCTALNAVTTSKRPSGCVRNWMSPTSNSPSGTLAFPIRARRLCARAAVPGHRWRRGRNRRSRPERRSALRTRRRHHPTDKASTQSCQVCASSLSAHRSRDHLRDRRCGRHGVVLTDGGLQRSSRPSGRGLPVSRLAKARPSRRGRRRRSSPTERDAWLPGG